MPVGYLFTDIEGSVERWETSAKRMADAVARHDAIIDRCVADSGGIIKDRAGDGVFAVLPEGNAIECALAIQRAVSREDWTEVNGLKLRVGVHVATPAGASLIDRAAVNRASRIMESGSGGQTVISEAASRAYRLPPGATLADLGVCYLKGIPEALRLFGLEHADLPAYDFPPLHSQFRSEGTIPLQVAPIFGRASDIEAISQALKQTRLLTVVAPGGNGKTRLAMELGKEWERNQPVLFLSLRGVSGSADLVGSIGEALRFPFRERVSQEAQLCEYFKDKRLLLVLDNADSLARDAGFVATLVASCPELAVLATSREPLRLVGEGVYRLGGVSHANDSGLSPALQLFMHAARNKESGFDLTDAQLPVFQQLCSCVGGSPLALRLMAQWVSFLSLEEILARVRLDLDFLGGAGNEDAHHRTLREVFEESWRRLDQCQRESLAALSVLEGPFHWKTAHEAFNTPLGAFAALERKCMIEPVAGRRFSIHPLIRNYAREKLAEAGVSSAVVAAHCAYFLNLLCSRMESMPELGQARALEEVHADFADIRAAWLTALHAGDDSKVARATEHLCYFLNLHSMLGDGVALFDDGPVSNSAVRLHLTAVRANFLFMQGEPARAQHLAEQIHSADDAPPLAVAHANMVLANLVFGKAGFETARACYEKVLCIREAENDRMGAAFATISLASLHLRFGDLAVARELIKSGFVISREIGLTFGLVVSHILAGDVALKEGRLDDAHANYASGLELERSANTPQYRGQLLRRAGSLALRMGKHDEADKHHTEALELFLDLGEQRSQAQAYVDLGEDSLAVGNLSDALDRFLRSVRLADAFGSQDLRDLALLGVARAELGLGNTQAATRIVRILRDTTSAQRPEFASLAQALGEGASDGALCELDAVLNEIANDANSRPLKL